MIENYREIYEKELDKSDLTPLERILIENFTVRSFVYEVCIAVIANEKRNKRHKK